MCNYLHITESLLDNFIWANIWMNGILKQSKHHHKIQMNIVTQVFRYMAFGMEWKISNIKPQNICF